MRRSVWASVLDCFPNFELRRRPNLVQRPTPAMVCEPVKRKVSSLLTRNVLGYHRLRHTRARLDLFCHPISTNTVQNNLQSSRGTARLRQMLRMRGVVKKPRWPHLRFFRPPQRCAHGPKPPARPVHDSRLCVVPRSAPARHWTRCFATTRRNRFLRGIYRL